MNNTVDNLNKYLRERHIEATDSKGLKLLNFEVNNDEIIITFDEGKYCHLKFKNGKIQQFPIVLSENIVLTQ